MKSVKLKITMVLTVITIIYTFILASALMGMNTINSSYSDLVDRRVVIQNNLQEILMHSQTQALAIRGHLISEELENEAQFIEAKNGIDQLVEDTRKMLSIEQYVKMLDEIQNLNTQFDAEYQKFLQEIENNATQEDKFTYWQTILLPIGVELREVSEVFAQETINIMFEEAAKNQERAESITRMTIIVASVVFIIVIISSILISNSIARPIQRITKATQVMANGDLTLEPVEVKTKDELHTLATAFNQMVVNLRQLLQSVVHSSERLAASSEELMASAEETARSTEQVTHSIQEVASGSKAQESHIEENKRALEEMTIGVTRVAEATTTVSEISEEAMKVSQSGRESITQVITQMKQINQSTNETADVISALDQRSAEIASIVNVITDISDQTNLLALNAAIEAARAGEHGKGFAVVADEVRTLAEQSKRSADDITGLILEIQKDTSKAVTSMKKGADDVALGLNVVTEAGEGFENINHSVVSMATQIMEITAVSEQMSASAEQLLASMEQILLLSQNAAANSENVAAASEEQLAVMQEVNSSVNELSQLAETLRNDVSTFKI